MLLAEASIVLSSVAIVLATASFGIAIWQAVVNWMRFRAERTARVAVDPGAVHRDDQGWTVELWLTNVGGSHARRVRAWLTDSSGQTLVSNIVRLPRPLLAGGESACATVHVPHTHAVVDVKPVRSWTDAAGKRDDPSDQVWSLEDLLGSTA